MSRFANLVFINIEPYQSNCDKLSLKNKLYLAFKKYAEAYIKLQKSIQNIFSCNLLSRHLIQHLLGRLTFLNENKRKCDDT